MYFSAACCVSFALDRSVRDIEALDLTKRLLLSTFAEPSHGPERFDGLSKMTPR